MNLATLVSSLVLAASTATAGLLAAPLDPLLPSSPQGGEDSDLQVGPLCVGSCHDGNETGGNETAPPSGNGTAPPPPHHNGTAPPEPHPAPPAETCGVDIHDGQNALGPMRHAWEWQVGRGTENLTVHVQADGSWGALGGGARILLVDGDGNVVARSESSGSLLPFDYTAIDYHGTADGGLSLGLWRLTVEADGFLGSVWVEVHSEC